MEISDVLWRPFDEDDARGDNCTVKGDCNVITVDRDRIQRDLPKILYRVRVKRRQAIKGLVIFSPY